MQCQWDVGAYYAAGAVLLWMVTAIGFALYQPRPEPSDEDDSSPNHRTNSTSVANHAQVDRPNNRTSGIPTSALPSGNDEEVVSTPNHLSPSTTPPLQRTPDEESGVPSED